MKKLCVLLLLFAAQNASACDFCLLGQGVNPYLTEAGRGISITASYMESDTVYDKSKPASSNGKKEAWNLYSLSTFFPVAENLTLLGSIPYAAKTNIDYDDTSGTNPGTLTTGIGDAALDLRYTFLREHSLESSLFFGVLGGIKAPTGSTSNHDNAGAAIDRHALPGTGSWDFDFGFSGTYARASGFQVSLDSVYRKAGKGKWDSRDHQYGDMLNYASKVYYRVARTEAGSDFFPFVGISGETTGKEKGTDPGTGYDANLVNPSTGGTVLYANLGLYSVLSQNTAMNIGYAKAFHHRMNYDTKFDADPAENYKLDFTITYLF